MVSILVVANPKSLSHLRPFDVEIDFRLFFHYDRQLSRKILLMDDRNVSSDSLNRLSMVNDVSNRGCHPLRWMP
jgi:hypothetical protein